MKLKFNQLTCCANGSGISGLITVENNKLQVVNRLLFNIGDGTQRFCNENSLKLEKVSAIIITSLAPHCIGGFQGVFLALSELGVETLNIFGPPGLKTFIDFLLPFINRKFPRLEIFEVVDYFEWKCVGGVVRFFPIRTETRVLAVSATFCFTDVVSMLPNLLISFLPVSCYFETAPEFEQIVQQEIEEFSPQDGCYLLCFVPSTVDSDISKVMKRIESFCMQKKLYAVVSQYSLCSDLVEFTSAQTLIAMCSRVCQPLYPKVFLTNTFESTFSWPHSPCLLRAYPMLTIESSQQEEGWLGFKIVGVEFDHCVDFVRTCFGKLSQCSLLSSSQADSSSESCSAVDATCSQSAVKLTALSMDSNWKWIDYEQENVISSLHKLNLIKSIGCTAKVPPPNPFDDKFTVTFLGTGSAKPSKYRSSSSILITMLPLSDFSIMLDVGESTASQLFQSVSGDLNRFHDCLRSIRVVWISHHHADHASGFTMLTHHIHKANQFRQIPPSKKVMVIGSEAVLQYCNFVCVAAGVDDLFEFLPIQNSLYAGLSSKICDFTNGNIRLLQSVPVSHCQDSYAVVMEIGNSSKIAYSGDCRPSQSFINIGLNCDLLIHEATFDDDKLEDAKRKRHSTISEALSVSSRMRAKHTILTHFSQRYPAININPGNGDITNISVANDFLRISFPSQVLYSPNATVEVTDMLVVSRSRNLKIEIAN